jgi:single-strand selective monofunctional uracil DNA glycosylase
VSLVEISRRLCRDVGRLAFAAPVTHVYNPLDYARTAHETYLEQWGKGPREIVLLGMNPGPWGMAQTGVPFGDVETVAGWLAIDVPVGRPSPEHPKRPVTGLACPRVEVSGRRLWGWARSTFGSPEAFFDRFLVLNHCPLLFLEESGRNRTPDRLPVAERRPLLELCDRALRESVELVRPTLVVGVGRFARQRAEVALAGVDVRVGEVLHPSPASPAANRGWAEQAERQLRELGVEL